MSLRELIKLMGKGKDKKGKELDLAGASRGVWLIKVRLMLPNVSPRYLLLFV